jgi:hypothetical protein
MLRVPLDPRWSVLVTVTPTEPPSQPTINHKKPIDPLAHREPRCRICREEDLRVRVDELLRWRGTPLIDGRGGFRCVTYSDIWQILNVDVDEANSVSYSSLWNHAKRHYGRSVTVDAFTAWMKQELIRALDVDYEDGM